MLEYRTNESESPFEVLNYCTQFDAFPKGLTDYQFVYSYLRLGGSDSETCVVSS